MKIINTISVLVEKFNKKRKWLLKLKSTKENSVVQMVMSVMKWNLTT